MRAPARQWFAAALLVTVAAATWTGVLATPIETRTWQRKVPTTGALCYKHLNPLKPNDREKVACEMETATAQRAGLKDAVASGTFVLNFSCPGGGPVCEKAQNTFNLAFNILLGNLILNTDILVNASFVDFCTVTSSCRSDGFQVLGGAAPERTQVLQDDDGVLRAYPQALVKQLNLPQRPRFTGSDIFAQFNSAAKFFFPGDPQPMPAGQSDFLFVVLHEMIHGLGFTSAWDDYLNNVPSALTPAISGTTAREGFVFNGFVENAFDRFVVETSTNTPISARAAVLNKLFAGKSTTFANVQAFSTALQSLDAFKANANVMFKLATTPQSLAFITNSKQKMLLETSLSSYQPGSSVSHADLKSFTDSSDFLMRFRVDPGVSLADAVQKGSGGPLGPTLLGVLEALGYATKANPNPFIKLKSAGELTAVPSTMRLALVTSMLAVLAPFVFLGTA